MLLGNTSQTSASASIPESAQHLPKPTINHQPVIELFIELMQLNSEARALRLLGDGNLGKTHFVKTIFPGIARQQYHARCAVVDLIGGRGPIAVLHDICGQIGGEKAFPKFHAAYRKWQNRPASRLQPFLSIFQTHLEQEASEDARWTNRLSTEFAADLAYLRDANIVLLFDVVDAANPNTRQWLIDTLLAQVLPLSHLRAVLGGRTMPEAPGSYATLCCSYELQPVTDEEAYISFCREIGVDLVEQKIRETARACEYKPGNFVGLVAPKSMRLRVSHV
jgi:hypothetical protein